MIGIFSKHLSSSKIYPDNIESVYDSPTARTGTDGIKNASKTILSNKTHTPSISAHRHMNIGSFFKKRKSTVCPISVISSKTGILVNTKIEIPKEKTENIEKKSSQVIPKEAKKTSSRIHKEIMLPQLSGGQRKQQKTIAIGNFYENDVGITKKCSRKKYLAERKIYNSPENTGMQETVAQCLGVRSVKTVNELKTITIQGGPLDNLNLGEITMWSKKHITSLRNKQAQELQTDEAKKKQILMDEPFIEACKIAAAAGSIVIQRSVNAESLGEKGVFSPNQQYLPKPRSCHAKSSYFGFSQGLVPANPCFSRGKYIPRGNNRASYEGAMSDIQSTLSNPKEGCLIHLMKQDRPIYQGTFNESGKTYRYQVALRADQKGLSEAELKTEVQKILTEKTPGEDFFLAADPESQKNEWDFLTAENRKAMPPINMETLEVEPCLVIGLPTKEVVKDSKNLIEASTVELESEERKFDLKAAIRNGDFASDGRYYVSDYDLYGIAHAKPLEDEGNAGQDGAKYERYKSQIEIEKFKNEKVPDLGPNGGEMADDRDIAVIHFINAELMEDGREKPAPKTKIEKLKLEDLTEKERLQGKKKIDSRGSTPVNLRRKNAVHDIQEIWTSNYYKNADSNFRERPIQHAAAAGGLAKGSIDNLSGFVVPDYPLFAIEANGIIVLNNDCDFAAYILHLQYPIIATDGKGKISTPYDCIFNSKVLDHVFTIARESIQKEYPVEKLTA